MVLALAWAEQETAQPSQLAAATALWALIAGRQPASDELTAIAALVTTGFGRNLLTMANAAAARSALELAEDRQVIATPVDGGSYPITASNARRIEVYFGNSGTLAAYTVVMPVLLDGQEIHFYWYGGVTSFTMTAASGQPVGSIITAAAVVANSRRSWKYIAAVGRVYPKT